MENNIEEKKELSIIDENKMNNIYNYLKNNEDIVHAASKLNLSIENLYGMIEMLSYYHKPITIVESNGKYVIKKGNRNTPSKHKISKPNINDLKKIKVGLISDCHLTAIYQQLHMVNKAYSHFYKEEITHVYNMGDLVDGDFTQKRREQVYHLFAYGADQQADYVVDMYPNISGMKTFFIQGSHDETHKKNGGVTLGKLISLQREDMIYVGQDYADVMIDNIVRFRMRHPGGGTSQFLSRAPQKTIDSIGSNKPKILAEGHYHKSYYFNRKNIPTILVPATCYQSQFMEKKDISNIMGYYILELYVDDIGDIHYIKPREYLFNDEQIKHDDYKKTRRLTIK